STAEPRRTKSTTVKIWSPTTGSNADSNVPRVTDSSGFRPQAATRRHSIRVANRRSMSEPSDEGQGNDGRQYHHIQDIDEKGPSDRHHDECFRRMTVPPRQCLHVCNGRGGGSETKPAEGCGDHSRFVVLTHDAEHA